MKVGDYVGWADTWSDEDGCSPVGIILEADDPGWDDGSSIQYLILLQHNGGFSWESGSDLVVMFESR